MICILEAAAAEAALRRPLPKRCSQPQVFEDEKSEVGMKGKEARNNHEKGIAKKTQKVRKK